MADSWHPRQNRVGPALAAGVVQCGLAAMILWGLAGRQSAPPKPDTPFVAITPMKPPAPAPTPTPAPSKPAERAAAAPPAAKAKSMPVAIPSPRIAIASPTPAARVVGQGAQASAGAALSGSGSGAGGQGDGTGAGGSGGGGGVTYPPVRVAGALNDRDYPRMAGGRGGTVGISFRVRNDGRVDGCRVIGSSGEEVLDELTCELVEARFRYRPARDETGQPVDYLLRTSFTWGQRQRW